MNISCPGHYWSSLARNTTDSGARRGLNCAPQTIRNTSSSLPRPLCYFQVLLLSSLVLRLSFCLFVYFAFLYRRTYTHTYIRGSVERVSVRNISLRTLPLSVLLFFTAGCYLLCSPPLALSISLSLTMHHLNYLFIHRLTLLQWLVR